MASLVSSLRSEYQKHQLAKSRKTTSRSLQDMMFLRLLTMYRIMSGPSFHSSGRCYYPKYVIACLLQADAQHVAKQNDLGAIAKLFPLDDVDDQFIDLIGEQVCAK